MAASCFSMATTQKLPPSLESFAAAGGGRITFSLCVKAHRSLRVAVLKKSRATVADSYALRGLSGIFPVIGNTSRGFRRTATAWSEGPPLPAVIDEEEGKGFVSKKLSEGEVLESEEMEGGVKVSGQVHTAQGSESKDSYEQTASPIPAPAGTKLYVGNVPYDISSEELARIFEESGVVEMVEMIYDKATERSRGFAFVTMSTAEEAKAAIQKFKGSMTDKQMGGHLQTQKVGGRFLRVNFPEVPRGSIRQMLRPSGSNVADSPHRVYVGNLPYTVTEDTLRRAFEKVGNVLSARLIYGRGTGRSRGFGFVTFSSGDSVDAAISLMNGVVLEGRSIRVKVPFYRNRK